MIILKPPPKPFWHTVEIAEGVSLEVRIEPPTFEALIAERTAETAAEAIALRLGCIVDWRGVMDDAPEPKPLPFSEAGLAVLIRSHRLAFDWLLVAVRPLFAIDEDHEKNSEPPPSAANVPTPPLNDSSPSTDSPNSGEPSA